MDNDLVIVAGPTAVGKTNLSIQLAKAIGGEIISADSMQVYRGMDIGTAKITPDKMQGISHYLVDQLDPDDDFQVVRFQTMAKEAIREIRDHGHIPILVGGTGFYIQAVLYDIDFTETGKDDSYRKSLEKIAREEGPEALHDRLKQVDPVSAAQIHPHNVKRVIRALEYYDQTGEPISEHNEEQRKRTSPYQYVYFVLDDERGHLYQRINDRVDQMIDMGLIDEVKDLKAKGYSKDLTSMQGLGYKEILDYLAGEDSLEEAVRVIKRDTRHFAKRQLTWFKKEPQAIWIEEADFQYDETKILQEMLNRIQEALPDISLSTE